MERQATHTPAVIFDFDGTVADSFSVALEVFYALTHREAFSPEDLMRLRGMTLRQLSKELKIPMHKIPFLLIRGRRAMFEHMARVRLVEGMDEVIRTLCKTHKLFILSSNSPANIEALLSEYGLAECFEAIYGDVSLLRKRQKLRQILRQHRLVEATTWYVGDEARDVEAAKRAHLRVAAVSWGFNNIHVLASHEPTALIFTPEELITCIYNNSNYEAIH